MTSINSGYKNNVNIIAMRGAKSSTQIYTDRKIDLNGDGVKETVSVTTTQRGGNKVKNVVTEPAGIARSVIRRTDDGDLGITLDRFPYTTEDN